MDSLESYLNTSDGMTQIATMQDDQTISCIGASWFKYNGVQCDTIYISGNSWIGFGVANEHMKIDRRDAKCHYLYRQEIEYNRWKCIKFRWEGYSYYNSTSESYRLVWELFLFETGDIFLNAIKISGSGVNSFDTLGGSGTFSPVTGAMISGYCGNVIDGKAFNLVNEIYYHAPLATTKYLIEIDSAYYNIVDNQLNKLDITLTAENFTTYGLDDLPPVDLLKTLDCLKIHRWQDIKEAELPKMQSKVNAIPKVQTIVQNYDIDFSHESIASIQNILINGNFPETSVLCYVISMDCGNTWKSYDGELWNTVDVRNLTDFEQNGMTKQVLESIINEQWIEFVTNENSLKYRFAVLINTDSINLTSISNIVVNYKNT